MGFKEEIAKKINTRKYGIMGTIIFHLVLIIILLSIGISGVIRNEMEIELANISPEELQQIMEENERREEIRQQTSEAEIQRMLRSLAVNENIRKNRADANEDIQKYIDEVMEGLNNDRKGNQPAKDKHYTQDSLQYELDKQEKKLDSLRSTIYAGESSASYKLDDRYIRELPIPVFRCEFGGKVVVQIIVDRKGAVRNAEIDPAQSQEDPCLHHAAKDASLRSRFNEDANAPAMQQGSITFNFVKQ